MQDEARIGFIGCGAMAGALAGGLLGSGFPAARILGSDVDAARRDHFGRELGVATTASNAELVARSELVVLAVKPKAVAEVLEDLGGRGAADLRRPLWVSIAAGVRLEALAARLPEGARIIRAMPNTPALVRAGATGLSPNPAADARDRVAARALFEGVGITWEAPREELLDAVTGLSGSGPAYLFAFLEALIEAGVSVGLPRDAAVALATQTVYGASKLARESDRSPAELRIQVSSPGGTTLAGLARLDAGGFAAAVGDAVRAATERSRELGSAGPPGPQPRRR